VFRLAVEKGWILRELARESLSLEDVFVRLTRQEPVETAAPAAETAPPASPEEPS
jgi:hypothetical protein